MKSIFNIFYRKNPKISDTRKFAVIILKVEQGGFTLRVNVSKGCRGNCKQCRPWSDCSSRSSLIWVCTVCPGLSVWKLKIITVNQFGISIIQWQSQRWTVSLRQDHNVLNRYRASAVTFISWTVTITLQATNNCGHLSGRNSISKTWCYNLATISLIFATGGFKWSVFLYPRMWQKSRVKRYCGNYIYTFNFVKPRGTDNKEGILW